MVIVVSEENGNVLVAKGSHTHPVDRRDELEQILRQHVGVTVELPSYRSREGIRLGAAAVASVLFVTSIWFSFSRGLESLTTVEIPVQYMNRDPAMEILDTSQHGVRLHLSGSGPLIGSIGPEQVKVRLDLNNATAGDNMFTITPENITLPPGVFLKKIEQPFVEVTLDFPTEKALPIQVDWTGKLPEHLILSEVKVYPEKAHVVGGSRILKDITTIYTEKVPLATIKESGSITVNLALKPASLQTAPGTRDSVTVEYKVKRVN
jgi:YbbR domain-containing protein